jgi:hypothetical protein
MVSSGQRSVGALEMANVLPGATFASEIVPTGSAKTRGQRARGKWLEAVRRKLERSDLLVFSPPPTLLFVDPDNGLEPAGFHPTSSRSGKSIMISEVHQLARPGRCLIVYHHHTRRASGHHAEMKHWADRLRASGFTTVDALHARPFSPRLYFLLDAPAPIRQRASRSRWIGRIASRGIHHHTPTRGISARSACWTARIRRVILDSSPP